MSGSLYGGSLLNSRNKLDTQGPPDNNQKIGYYSSLGHHFSV